MPAHCCIWNICFASCTKYDLQYGSVYLVAIDRRFDDVTAPCLYDKEWQIVIDTIVYARGCLWLLFHYQSISGCVCEQTAVLYVIHPVCQICQQTVDCRVTMLGLQLTSVVVL